MPDYSGHMTHDEYIAIRREELLGIARDVLNNRILGVEACVRMAPMLGELNLRQDEDLLIIVGVDSECDYIFENKKLSPKIHKQHATHLTACEEGYRKWIRIACE
jgi:hypothetical protein